ncbi:MAG: hypothetical protein ACPGVE_08425, partial [Flavobacteriales bacterium]
IAYLYKRQLTDLYLKAKRKIENNDFKSVRLKKRQPYSENIIYFRLDRKYRAFATRENDALYVFKISDHQK